MCKRYLLCTCVYDFTIIYSSSTFKHVNVLRRLKCTLCKQTLSNICLTFIRTKLEYACDVLVEHNIQVEILFALKQCGNICLLGVKIAGLKNFTICIIHSVPNIWVIVYLLQYNISMITISEAMKTMQHHKVNYQCLRHYLYHPLFRHGKMQT